MLFTCLHCKVTSFARSPIEYRHGDWIICCLECGTENILATTTIRDIAVPLPTLNVVAFRPQS